MNFYLRRWALKIKWVDLSGTRLQAVRIPAWQTRIVGQRPIYPRATSKILRRLPINKIIAADVLEPPMQRLQGLRHILAHHIIRQVFVYPIQ